MKTIELIDKYEVHQSEEGDYNPPNYIWVDNTGELIRCKDCKHRFEGEKFHNCCEVLMEMSHWLVEIPVEDDWHCGSGERKEE